MPKVVKLIGSYLRIFQKIVVAEIPNFVKRIFYELGCANAVAWPFFFAPNQHKGLVPSNILLRGEILTLDDQPAERDDAKP
jgi:hypothetical protein